MDDKSCSNPRCPQRDHWTRFWVRRFWFQSEPYCSASCLVDAVREVVGECLSRPKPSLLPSPRRARIGAILVSKGLISRAQLQSALERQKRSGRPLGRCLVELGFLSHRDLTVALSEQHGIPWLEEFSPSSSEELLDLFPKRLCQTFKVVPVDYQPRSHSLVVVLGAPFESSLIPMFRRMLECEVQAFLGDDGKVGQLIERYVEPLPDEESHHRGVDGENLESIVQSITEFRRSVGARQLWIDLFRDTLWARFRTRRKFNNLFLDLGDGGQQGALLEKEEPGPLDRTLAVH